MTNRYDHQTIIRGGDAGSLNLGLRSFFTKVYGYMSGGLLLTGITALAVASNPAIMQALFGSGLVWMLFIGQIGLVAYLSVRATLTVFILRTLLKGISPTESVAGQQAHPLLENTHKEEHLFFETSPKMP